MKDYASMSDQELGRLVAAARGMDGGGSYSGATLVVRNGVWDIFDPCNNPADAWQIIESSYISIQFYQGNWMASVNPSQESGYRSACFIGKNPLKAAMVVFLMMKESEND